MCVRHVTSHSAAGACDGCLPRSRIHSSEQERLHGATFDRRVRAWNQYLNRKVHLGLRCSTHPTSIRPKRLKHMQTSKTADLHNTASATPQVAVSISQASSCMQARAPTAQHVKDKTPLSTPSLPQPCAHLAAATPQRSFGAPPSSLPLSSSSSSESAAFLAASVSNKAHNGDTHMVVAYMHSNCPTGCVCGGHARVGCTHNCWRTCIVQTA